MSDVSVLANQILFLDTPLGDELALQYFSGTEGISQLFNFRLELTSPNRAINFRDIIGRNVTARVRLASGHEERCFNGYVSRFAQLPGDFRVTRYQAEVVPWLWFLTRTADCRIFQNKSVPDVVRQIFEEFGFRHFENQLQRSYEPWEYCVQYRETAFNFVMRLMEQEGIYFYFRHEPGRHTLVLGDVPLVHKPCPNQPEARYVEVAGPGVNRHQDTVIGWKFEQQIRSGKYALNDYNFESPHTSLLNTVESRIEFGRNGQLEIYDYPGEYAKRDQGDAWVRLRMEEEEAAHEIITGESSCRAFCPGFKFTLQEHPRPDQNIDYVLTSVSHAAHECQGEVEGGYRNFFTCLAASVPFRPPRLTPKPLVQGCQTAVVVGPAGEEIYTDKHGRVKVQFHWDRRGAHNENSSCWVRVSHPWAGKNWGAISIPRIGQEVVVDFLEGDPDQPLIVGRVYNADQMPPYPLPDGAVVSGIKSNTTKGGGGYNEISMNDRKDNEMITIHAQKDMSTKVEHDDSQVVINDRTIHVTGTHTETIKKDTSITVTEGKFTHNVASKTADYHVKGAVKETFEATQTTNVTKNIDISSGTAHIHLTADNDEIQLKSGLSKLVMKKDGTIELSGKTITITGTQEVKAGVQTQTVTCNTAKVIVSGASISSTAMGIHDISGALVKIN